MNEVTLEMAKKEDAMRIVNLLWSNKTTLQKKWVYAYKNAQGRYKKLIIHKWADKFLLVKFTIHSVCVIWKNCN